MIGDETLVKVIRVLLLDHYKQASVSVTKNPSSNNLLQRKYPINPPTFEAISSLSPQIRQILQTLQCVLELDLLQFQEQLLQEFQSLSRDAHCRDVAMYRYFLERNWLWENYSLNREAELNSVQMYLKQNAAGVLQQYCEPHPQKIAVVLRVIDGKSLYPKDLGNLNNPYFTVTFCNLTWVGPIRKGTLNPVFDFSIPLYVLLIRFIHQQQEAVLTITLWNRSSVHYQRQEGPKKDAFLGCVSFSTLDILGICGAEPKYFTLQKRSKNSHVSGSLSIQFRELSKDRMTLQSLFSSGLLFVPSDPENKFWDLVRAVYKWEFRKMNQTKLTPPSETLLRSVSSVWRIRKVFESICKLDVAMELFSGNSLAIESLYSHFLDSLEKVSEVDNASIYEIGLFGTVCHGMMETLNSQISTFFHLPRKHATGKYLEIITFILGAIYNCPMLHLPPQDLLTQIRNSFIVSLNTRYQALEDESRQFPEIERLPLVFLVESIREDLEHYRKDMDVLLCGYRYLIRKLDVPILAANVYLESLSMQLESFTHTYTTNSPDMGIVFDLYHSVRELQKTYEQIDFRLADRFPMTKWFRPFVLQWLSYSEGKLFQWVKSAMDHDDLKRMSDQVAHSSSVLDMFTSFQQLIDFVKGLDWPNEHDSRRFYFAVFYDIIAAIARYGFLTIDQLNQHLATTRQFQPPPASKKAKIGKLKVTIPKMIRKKQVNAQTGQTRLSPEACIRVVNNNSIKSRFRSLVENIPQLHSVTSPQTPHGGLLDSRSTYIVRIKILNGQLRPVRPWPTLMRARISNKNGKVIGRTDIIRQVSNPSWNTPIYAIYDTNSPLLHLGIVHYIDHLQESLFSYSSFSTEGLCVGNPIQTKVSFGEYGFVMLECELMPETKDSLIDIMDWICDTNEDIMTDYIVGQLTFDFRDRIHPISLKYKTNVITKLFKDDVPSTLSSEDIQDIEEYLAPLFEFMNSNLEVLMCHMDDHVGLKIVTGVWNRFVMDAESLIVPSLLNDAKEQKQWDERRFQFFVKYIDLAAEFFRGDGQGLSNETIHSKQYVGLLYIMKNYFKPRDELIQMYRAMDKSGDIASLDWILKLIKMKGGKEFVEDQLGLLCSNRKY